jgi:DNA-binding FrmR family transcriptional regulator
MAVSSPRSTPPDKSDEPGSEFRDAGGNASGATDSTNKTGQGEDSNQSFLELARAAETIHNGFIAAQRRTAWQDTLRAYHNEHSQRSRFSDKKNDAFRNRSDLFRPKTRSAVRKNCTAAANALFSNSDVVSITAENDSNPVKQASASAIKEIVNYRLDRTSTKGGIPWFRTVVGGMMNAQLTALVVSKQYWDYSVSKGKKTFDVTETATDEATGEPIPHPETGEPMTRTYQEEQETEKIVRDRPYCALVAPENAMLDVGAPWDDPVQGGDYFVARWPMTVEAVRTMLKSPGKKGATKWLKVEDSVLSGAAAEYDSEGLRQIRNQGQDPQAAKAAGPPQTRMLWMHENFWRIDGVDMHWWTVGTRAVASEPQPTEESYPEQFGERPYAVGYGAIEPHTVYPMAPAESWQPVQKEINNIVNLRIDTMMQALSPIAKVKAGTMFDWAQLHRRGGPDANIIVRDVKDLEFDRMPSSSMESYKEVELLNNDFDDLAGVFGQSSVQSNRSLNETVGGMRLLSGTANGVTEFDLRVFTETWVEVVLRQIVRLCQFYETDETVLELAGDRAKMERFGVDQITDNDLMTECSVKVNVGIGSVDPTERIKKVMAVMQALGGIAPYMTKKWGVKGEEIIPELFGLAGYNDGMRFFEEVGGEGGGQDPEAAQAQMEGELKKAQIAAQQAIAANKDKTSIEVQRLKGQIQIIDRMLQEMAAQQALAVEQQFAASQSATQSLLEAFKTHSGHQKDVHLARHGALSAEDQQREKLASAERTAGEATASRERAGLAQLIGSAHAGNQDRAHKERMGNADRTHQATLSREDRAHQAQTGREQLRSKEQLTREGFAHQQRTGDKQLKSKERMTDKQLKAQAAEAKARAAQKPAKPAGKK